MKPLFISLAILIVSSCLHGEVYQWNDTSYQYLIAPGTSSGEENDDLNREDGGGSGTSSVTFIHQVDVKINKFLSAFFQTDMNWEERNPKNLMTSASKPASFYKNWRVTGTYNRFQTKLEYHDEKLYGKFQYRNQYFESGRTNATYIFITNPNLPFDTPESGPHRPHFIHDIYNQGIWKTGIGTFDVGGRVRVSKYNLAYWENIGDTLSVFNQVNTQRDELFLNANVQVPITSYFSLITDVYAKHDDTDKYFDFTRYGIGLAFDRKFDFFHMLNASFQYDRNNSNAYSQEKDNYFTSQLRYTHRIGTSLTAFISIINRSVHSEHNEGFLLISNVVRIQARYSFKNDINGDSYIILGGKLSPENKTSLVFAEFNYPIIPKLYANVMDKYSPTYLYVNQGAKETAQENETSLGLNYYFTPWQMVYIMDTVSVIHKIGLLTANQNLLSIGTKLVF
jgi:hypothetical protein